jgi:hypothetical protein
MDRRRFLLALQARAVATPLGIAPVGARYARYERLATGPLGMRAMLTSELQRDLRSISPAIRVPTLVLHRIGDRFIRVGHGRYIAENIPGATYVELPGSDHVPYVGETQSMLEEIEEFLTGMRPPPELNRVLATVLFTDIVGSTERAAAVGDRAWRAIIESHHELARQELERHRGREIESRGRRSSRLVRWADESNPLRVCHHPSGPRTGP